MNQRQPTQRLRPAIMMVLPLFAVMSCAQQSATVRAPVAKPAHPCGNPLKTQAVNLKLTGSQYTGGKLLTGRQCLSLCKDVAERPLFYPSRFKKEMTGFNISQCSTKEASSGLSAMTCDVSYTLTTYPSSKKPGCVTVLPGLILKGKPDGA